MNRPTGSDAGVKDGALLLSFVDAVMADDDAQLARERSALLARLGAEAFVDTCAVVAAFNVVDRVADATGIPLDDGLARMSAGVRDELDLARFASSANTPAS